MNPLAEIKNRYIEHLDKILEQVQQQEESHYRIVDGKKTEFIPCSIKRPSCCTWKAGDFDPMRQRDLHRMVIEMLDNPAMSKTLKSVLIMTCEQCFKKIKN